MCIRDSKHQIRFPNGVSFFEDSNFHLLILMNMSSFQIMDLPTFTYFRRYGEKRLTDSRSYLRFDAFAAVINVMPVSYTHLDVYKRQLL